MLRKLDYLEWLKNQEEFILWNIDGWKSPRDLKRIKEAEGELQIVRELKEIVQNYEAPDFGSSRYADMGKSE